MRWSGSSYIDRGCARQSSATVRFVTIALLTSGLFGCAGLGLPFGEAALDRNLSTGSIQKISTKGSGNVDQSDWEAVRLRIAQAAAEKHSNGSYDWKNPKTGTTGTVSILNTLTPTNDPNCRNFQTTVNDTRGIRHYRGEACQVTAGRWQLYGVLADDSQLL